jgi:hypothetical protein
MVFELRSKLKLAEGRALSLSSRPSAVKGSFDLLSVHIDSLV